MIKTYLVPLSEELAEVILNKPNNILRDSTCLSGLTNGEVIQKMFPEMSEIEIVKDEVVVSDTGTEIVCNFSKKWWNAKLGQMRWISK